MGVENLSFSVIQGNGLLDSNGLASSLLPAGDTAAATAFLEQLVAQLAEIGEGETTQTIVDGLNTELSAAAIELQDGNLLPQAAIPDPLASAGLCGQNDRSPAAVLNPRSALGQPGVGSAGQATAIQEPVIPGLSPNTNCEDAETRPSELLSGMTETSLRHPLEKTLTESVALAKNETLNAQPVPRTATESEKAPVLNVQRSIADPEWKQELGDRVIWMSRNSLAAAELKVNPPQMGPVEVRIHLNQDQMNVAFATQNAAVRDAIEAAVPRLREMLGGQQLNLMNVDISHSFADQRQQQSGGDPNRQTPDETFSSAMFDTDATDLDSLGSGTLRKNHGLLNYYV